MYVEHERADELRRLRHGPSPDERPFVLHDEFRVSCRGQAAAVLERAREACRRS
jgi:hypothetical protein